MAIQHPDIQPAVNHSVQVAIAGAGPVGLMMANYLGQMGIDVLVVEKLDKLIDYPRAIGIDDEALRTMQSVGLVDNVLPHTTPWHAMRFLTPKGRCFADIQSHIPCRAVRYLQNIDPNHIRCYRNSRYNIFGQKNGLPILLT